MRVHVPLAQDQVLLGPDLDLEPGVGREQDVVARLDVAHRRADLDDLGPDQAPVDVRGGRDQDPGPGLALPELVGRAAPAGGRRPCGSTAWSSSPAGGARIGAGSVIARRLPPIAAVASRMLRGAGDRPATVGDRGGTSRRSARPTAESGAGRTRRPEASRARRRPELREHDPGVLPADEAAGHRAAARHDGPGDDPRRRRPPVALADRRGARRRGHGRGRRQHDQLLDRARPRQHDAAHPRPPASRRATSARPARWSSGSCSRSLAFALLWATVEPARRLARGERHALLRLRLHALAEAPQHAEHRHRRRGRCGPGARRLGRGHRLARGARLADVRRSSSSGRRPTSGRCRSATATTTQAAGIPMLPVVRGIPAAARQIVVVLVHRRRGRRCCCVPVSTLSWGYAAAATVLGVDVHRAGDPPPRRPHPAAGDQALHASRTSTSRCCSRPLPSTPSSAPSDGRRRTRRRDRHRRPRRGRSSSR